MREIILALFGSGILNLFIVRYFAKQDNKGENCKLIEKTMATLLYTTLSSKLSHLRKKGFADSGDRREIEMIHEVYKDWGFNGDMDTRLDYVYNLPYCKPECDVCEK